MDCLGRRIKLAVKLTYGHYSSLAIAIGFCSTQIRFSRPVEMDMVFGQVQRQMQRYSPINFL